MRPKERQDRIVDLVTTSGELAVEDLAAQLAVSKETIRRDLAALDAASRLRKFHGGARTITLPAADMLAAEVLKESPFAQRMAQNAGEKRRIAAAAGRLFRTGDTIFIDTGSTTHAMAEELAGLSMLLVITNSPHIARVVAGNRSNKVFLIGGAYGPDAGESLGPLALEQIAKFRASHVILTVGAIDAAGVMDFDLAEAEIARAMIDRAERVTVLADHSKFGRRAVFDVAPLDRIATVVTDRTPGADMKAALDAAGVDVVLAAP